MAHIAAHQCGNHSSCDSVGVRYGLWVYMNKIDHESQLRLWLSNERRRRRRERETERWMRERKGETIQTGREIVFESAFPLRSIFIIMWYNIGAGQLCSSQSQSVYRVLRPPRKETGYIFWWCNLREIYCHGTDFLTPISNRIEEKFRKCACI